MEGLSIEVVVCKNDRGLVQEWLKNNLPYVPVVYRSGKKGTVKIIANKQVEALFNTLRKFLAEKGIALSIWDRENQ